MLKPLTVWIVTNCGKLLKRWKYQTILPVSWENWKWVKKQQLESCIEQLTGSGLRKANDKAACHLVYLTYTLNTSWKMPGWMSYKLESRLMGQLKSLSYSILSNRRTPFFSKVLGKRLKIPWPHPTTQEPIRPRTKISWPYVQKFVVCLGNKNQSEINTQPFERGWPIERPPAWKSLHTNIPCISNVTQNLGLLPIAAASVTVGAPARAW